MQGQFVFTGIKLHGSTGLPVPVCACRSKGHLEGLAVHDKLKPPWRAWGLPAGHPVFGADPHMMWPCFRRGNGCGGVGHGLTQPMGQEIRRAHFSDKLGIEFPAASVGKAFRLDQDSSRAVRRQRRACDGRHERRKKQDGRFESAAHGVLWCVSGGRVTMVDTLNILQRAFPVGKFELLLHEKSFCPSHPTLTFCVEQ